MKLPPLRSWLRPRDRAAKIDVAATLENALRVLPVHAPSSAARPAFQMPRAARGVLSPSADVHRAPDTPGFAAGRHAGRDYRLFVPEGDASVARPLLVMLHGCKQDPADFALGTRMNAHAAEHGVLVLYPEQPATANPARCWNWFRPEDQRRGSGEPEAIVALVREVSRRHRIDADRVYVAGLSAGGAMAAILAQQYPEIFAAVGVHSGLAPGAASDATSAFAAMRQGTRPSPLAGTGRVPAIVLHGDRDTTVHPANAGRVLAALLPRDAQASVEDLGHARRSVFRSPTGVVGEHWVLPGAGHAWSGGDPQGSHAAAGGVDASAQMLRFFLQHPRRR